MPPANNAACAIADTAGRWMPTEVPDDVVEFVEKRLGAGLSHQ